MNGSSFEQYNRFMPIKPKTYKEMMDDMLGAAIAGTKLEDFQAGSAIDALSKALEVGLYGGCPTHEVGMRKLLEKLGIKSAWHGRSPSFGMPLQVEGLDAMLKNVTFDDKDLKLHKAITKF
jgi:hypothetical protein